MRQDNLLGVDLRSMLEEHLYSPTSHVTSTSTNSLIWRAFSSSVTPPPFVNRTNGIFLLRWISLPYVRVCVCFYLPVASIIAVQQLQSAGGHCKVSFHGYAKLAMLFLTE